MIRDSPRDTAFLLRAALVLLAAAAMAGTALELAIERHWHGLEQWYAWIALVIAAVGLLAIVARPSAIALWFARACGLVAIVMAAIGVWRHIHANFETAPLDFRYSDRWDTMAFSDQLWAVVSGDVGPSPILASGVLALIGVAIVAATIGASAASADPDAGRRPDQRPETTVPQRNDNRSTRWSMNPPASDRTLTVARGVATAGGQEVFNRSDWALAGERQREQIEGSVRRHGRRRFRIRLPFGDRA